MFGMKRRAALIKKLVEIRLLKRNNDSEAEVHAVVNSLGPMELMNMPEALIVTVLEFANSALKQGAPVKAALGRQERLRKTLRSDSNRFQAIMALSETDPSEAIIQYIVYRIELEAKYPGILTHEEVSHLAAIAIPEVRRW
jgi:hypothetical protein